MIYVLVKKGVNYEKHPAINRNIEMVSKIAKVEVSRNGLIKTQSHKVTALGPVEFFQFSMITTGNTKLKVQLVDCNCAALSGPVARQGSDLYQVVFNRALNQGDNVEFTLLFTLDDPDSTMRPFSSDTFSSCGKYGSFSAEYEFKGGRPTVVHGEVLSGVTGGNLEPMRPLMPTTSGKFVFDTKQVIPNASYTVSWIW